MKYDLIICYGIHVRLLKRRSVLNNVIIINFFTRISILDYYLHCNMRTKCDCYYLIIQLQLSRE